ncbi:MAG: NAD(P)/FAD-dependent oxidoreductase [Smithella sp.]
MKKIVEGNDIAIIGSGIGGLSAGIILLLLKYNVTIVEKNPVPGGMMRSYRRSGIDCPVGVHYVGALGEDEPLGRIFNILGIKVDDIFEKMGQDGVIDHYIFENFTFDLPAGIDSYEKNLKSAFPDDSPAIDTIIHNLRRIAQSMLDPSFLLSQSNPFQNLDYFDPMRDYLEKLNASPGLQAVLAVPAQLVGVPMPECPVIFHHMVLAGYLMSCWRLKESGSRMADIFARRFMALGGKLILNDRVQKILLQSGKVSGLELQSGKSLTADAVVAAIHPKVMLGLLEPAALKASYRQRLLDVEETKGVIVIHAGVDSQLHPEIPHNIYRLEVGEKGIINDGIFYQLRRSNVHGSNLLTIITKSPYSEWSKWENTSSGRRGADYEEKKMNIAKNLLREARTVFTNLKNPVIVDVFTPLTLRDYVNCPEGSCYGIMRSSGQMLKIASLNNIPLSGLYPAGQNVVAPGVLGCLLGSLSTAQQIAGRERFLTGLNGND